MRLTQIFIVPELSEKSSGNQWYRYNEWDIIKGYMIPLIEHLDEDRIKYELIKPGEYIEQNSLVIHCRGGWSNAKKSPEANSSGVAFGNNTSKTFAERVRESIADWGKCYVDSAHRTRDLGIEELCGIENTMSIAISPFQLNAPNAEAYLKRLPDLGRAIESCIFAYLISRSEVPSMMRVKYE